MLKLYSYFRSSASYRVRIALYLKNIHFEYVPVHLVNRGGEQRLTEFLQKNPMGQVPTLEDGDLKLSQSMAILRYLDDLYPSPALFPIEPRMAAKCIEICEIVNSGIHPIQNLSVLQKLTKDLGMNQNGVSQWAKYWINKGFTGLEQTLQQTAGQFCLGGELSAADLFVVPQVYNARRFKVDMTQFATISRIEQNCLQLEAFQKAEPHTQPDTPKELFYK